MSQTPVKRQLNYSTWHSPPSKSPWKSPVANRGQSENITGYIILVGQEEISKNNNRYYDIAVQRSDSDFSTVRIMVNGTTKDGVHFLEEIGSVVYLYRVFPSEDMFFYNEVKGSKMEFKASALDFDKISFSVFTKKIGEVQESVLPLIHVESQIRYVGEVRLASNGSEFRNAVLYDISGHVYFTLWQSSMFNLNEGTMLYITNLRLKNYYGIELSTTKNTIFSYSDSVDIDPLDDAVLGPYIIRASGSKSTKDLTVEYIDGASFDAIMRCPDRNCTGKVQKVGSGSGSIGACDACPKRVNLKSKANKLVLEGEVNVGGLTLGISAANIDQIFGAGTHDFYLNKKDDLADKLLQLEQVTISYNSKTNTVLTWNCGSGKTS